VHEQRLGRVADARALGLGVEHDLQRGVEVGGGVDVDVAVARGRVDHRHLRDGAQRLLQALPAARDDQVDDALLRGQLGELVAAAGHQRDRAVGKLRRHDRGEHGVRVGGGGGPAKHDRVAGLQAQRGGVDGDVRARLIDDRDHAERHAHLAHVEPVREPEAVDHLPDGIGQGGDRAHGAGDRADPRGVERQPVHQRGREPGLAAGLEVAGVGLEDLGRALLECVGDAQQRGVLARRAHARELARRGLGGAADLGDGRGRDGHTESEV
jgi:hypothetical protein